MTFFVYSCFHPYFTLNFLIYREDDGNHDQGLSVFRSFFSRQFCLISLFMHFCLVMHLAPTVPVLSRNRRKFELLIDLRQTGRGALKSVALDISKTRLGSAIFRTSCLLLRSTTVLQLLTFFAVARYPLSYRWSKIVNQTLPSNISQDSIFYSFYSQYVRFYS